MIYVMGVEVRIGELSRRTGVSVRSLRWYGELALLREVRTAGGHREYGDDAVDRVRTIQLLFAAGVPARYVVELLPCMYSGTSTPEMVARLEQERARLQARAVELQEILARLDEVVIHTRAVLVPA